MRWVGIMAVLCVCMGVGCRDETPAPVVDLLGASAWLMSDEGSVVPQFTVRATPRLRFREAPPKEWTLHLRQGETLFDVPVTADPPYWRTQPPDAPPGWARLELHIDGAISRIWHVHWGPARQMAPIDVQVALARKSDKPVEAWLKVADVAEEAMVPSEQSRALRAAAYYALWEHDLDRAASLLDQSEALDQPLRNRKGLLMARRYRALIAEMMGRFRAASRSMQTVAETAQELGEDTVRWSVLQDLAALYSRLGRHELAVSAQRQAMNLPPPSDRGRTEALTNLAWVRMNAALHGRDAEGVTQALDAALKSARALKDATLLVNAVANRAAWAWYRAEFERAQALVSEAKKIEPRDAAPRARLYLLRFEAELLLREGQLDQAQAAFTQSQAALDPDAAWRGYHGLARVAARRGDAHQEEVELHRAVAAIQQAARQVDLTQARGSFVADRQRAFRDLVAMLVARGRLAEAFAVDEADRSAVLRALDFQGAVDALAPERRVAFVKALNAWRKARAEEEAEIKRAWAVPAAELSRWRAARAQARAELARRFDAVQALVELDTPTAADTAAIQARLGPGQVIHANLGDTAVWVSETGVARANSVLNPGHVFVIGDTPVPGLTGSISYLPFASLLLRQPADIKGPALFVVDPTEDLPQARKEGLALSKGHAGSTVLVGPQATRKAVLAAEPARLFHFAGHGVLTPDDPWTAHLRLHGDTRLTLTDVLAMGPRFGVVVLNGCETGQTQSVGGRHRVGLPAAFLAAGARAVVATRRKVPDDQAARFIARFHANGGAERPGAALQKAIEETQAAGGDIGDAFYLAGRP